MHRTGRKSPPGNFQVCCRLLNRLRGKGFSLPENNNSKTKRHMEFMYQIECPPCRKSFAESRRGICADSGRSRRHVMCPRETKFPVSLWKAPVSLATNERFVLYLLFSGHRSGSFDSAQWRCPFYKRGSRDGWVASLLGSDCSTSGSEGAIAYGPDWLRLAANASSSSI